MTNRYQSLRSSISGNLPAQGSRQVGELWINFPDLQMGLIDTSKTPQKLLAVRNFSASAAYAQNDMVVQTGAIYVANAAIPAGAFNATLWTKLATVGDLATGFVPLTGGTMTGFLTLNADPASALHAATKHYVDVTVGGGYLPITGGTVTGPLTVQGALTAASPANVNLSPTGSGTVTIAPATLGHMNNTQIGGVTPANGTFLALTATGTATFSPAGASVAISPTAGGTVTINPAGAGTINNMSIGASVASTGAFTTVTASSNVASYTGVFAPSVYVGWPTYNDHYLTTDSNGSYYYRGSGWSDQWVRSNGNRYWNSASTNLMILDNAGNLTAAGHVHAGTSNNNNVYAGSVLADVHYFGYPTATTWYTVRSGSLYLFQWQTNWYESWNVSNGARQWVGAGVVLMSQDGSGGFSIGSGYAGKPGGGAWSDTSDIRIKTVQGDYPQGLDAINKLRPVAFTFKGNDTPTADFDLQLPETPTVEGVEQGDAIVPQHAPRPRGMTTAPYNASPHYQVAADAKVFAGFVAQELETIFPEMVSEREGYIDGVHVTDLKHVDTTPLIYALVNAVKELSARIVALEGAL